MASDNIHVYNEIISPGEQSQDLMEGKKIFSYSLLMDSTVTGCHN